MTPKIGARYSINAGKRLRPSIWELVRIEAEGAYPYVLSLVSADPQKKRTPGEEMEVEGNWFVWRSALGASIEGAVREVP
jgi:hypothetical protein